MRRLTIALAIGVTIAATSCKRAPRPAPAGAALVSVVQVEDPRTSAQLVSGFYPLEDNTWRWAAGKFSAELKPPVGAGEKGAKLELKLNVPDVVIKTLGSITLTASAGGARLTPQKFTEAGSYIYAVDVPADALRSDSVVVEFSTDKAIPPGQIEKRELAVIVTSVGLVAKP
jgi:hypothetical protein